MEFNKTNTHGEAHLLPLVRPSTVAAKKDVIRVPPRWMMTISFEWRPSDWKQLHLNAKQSTNDGSSHLQ
eukprot:s701_g12.t1